MSLYFEELDYRSMPIGALSLRRRREWSSGVDVFEIKLGDDYLMSSLFTASEVALARLGLAAASGTALDVVVGGLGLGYTAHAVLGHESVRSMIVVEMLDAVVEWHDRGLLPLGRALHADARCRFVRGDFFALAASQAGFDAAAPERLPCHPRRHRSLPGRAARPAECAILPARGIGRRRGPSPSGRGGLWSNAEPDGRFTARLAAVFPQARAEPMTIHNPLQNRPVTQTVYLARTAVT